MGSGGALGADTFQEHVGWFVVLVLRNQFAAKGFGEDSGFQPVEQRAGASGFGFETIGAGEGCIYDSNAFVPLLIIKKWQFERQQRALGNVVHRYAACCLLDLPPPDWGPKKPVNPVGQAVRNAKPEHFIAEVEVGRRFFN